MAARQTETADGDRIGCWHARAVPPNVRLRPLRVVDEEPGRAADDELGDYGFFLDFDPSVPWIDFLDRMQRQRRGIEPDRVPAAFLVAWVGDQIVGRASVRFDLNDYLAHAGGHIGYAVLPQHRRRGYATEILRQSLVVGRAEGVDDVLVTCDVDNVGSRMVIERCGGEFESIVHDTRERVDKRRYWIH
jgi:predicted acetyltransferase